LYQLPGVDAKGLLEISVAREKLQQWITVTGAKTPKLNSPTHPNSPLAM
jgi:hypothetical protein